MYPAQTPRCFSTGTEDKPEAAGSAKVPEPTQAELERGQQEWGIKYDDECLKFEKEWEIMAKAVEDDYLFGPLSVDSYVVFRTRPLAERIEKTVGKLSMRGTNYTS